MRVACGRVEPRGQSLTATFDESGAVYLRDMKSGSQWSAVLTPPGGAFPERGPAPRVVSAEFVTPTELVVLLSGSRSIFAASLGSLLSEKDSASKSSPRALPLRVATPPIGPSGGEITCLAVVPTPDRARPLLAAGASSGLVVIWDASAALSERALDAEPISLIPRAHNGPVTSIAPLYSACATGGQDQAVRLWDAPTGKLLQTLNAEASQVTALLATRLAGAEAGADEALVAGTAEGTVFVWELDSMDLVGVIAGFDSRVLCLAAPPKGGSLAVGYLSGDLGLHVASAPDFASTGAHRMPKGALVSCAYRAAGPKGAQFTAWSSSGFTKVWLELDAPRPTAAADAKSDAKTDAKTDSKDGPDVRSVPSAREWQPRPSQPPRALPASDTAAPQPETVPSRWAAVGLSQPANPASGRSALNAAPTPNPPPPVPASPVRPRVQSTAQRQRDDDDVPSARTQPVYDPLAYTDPDDGPAVTRPAQGNGRILGFKNPAKVRAVLQRHESGDATRAREANPPAPLMPMLNSTRVLQAQVANLQIASFDDALRQEGLVQSAVAEQRAIEAAKDPAASATGALELSLRESKYKALPVLDKEVSVREAALVEKRLIRKQISKKWLLSLKSKPSLFDYYDLSRDREPQYMAAAAAAEDAIREVLGNLPRPSVHQSLA